MKKTIVLISLFSILMYGCNQIARKTMSLDNPKKIILSEYKTSLMDSLFFRSGKLLPLETNDKSILSRIDRVCIDGDTIFILDKSIKSVLVFDMNGCHIKTIRTVGEGPTEYTQIYDMGIDTQRNRIVLSCGPSKVIYYSYTGNFVSQFKMPRFFNEHVINNGYIYGYKSEFTGDLDISIYDDKMNQVNGSKLDSGRTIKIQQEGETYTFGQGSRLTGNSSVFLVRQFDNSIYTLETDGIHRKYDIDFKEHTLPLELLDTKISSHEFYKKCRDSKYVCAISDVVENKEYLFFNTDIGPFIYDKKNDKLTGYNSLFNSTIGGGVSELMSTNSGHIVQVFQASILKMLIEFSIKRDKDWITKNPFAYELYKSINEESNPVLFIYEW